MIAPVVVIVAFVLGVIFVVGMPLVLLSIGLIGRANKFDRLPGTGSFTSKGGPALYKVDAALLDFVDEWARRFGGGRQQLIDIIEGLYIDWVEGDWFDHPTDATRKLAGLTVGPKEIRVALMDGTIGKTAFFHELVHVALWGLEGEPDPNHDDPNHWDTWKPEHDELIRDLRARWTPE